MNSSGIKRGLASAAIAALAVTGLPFLASTASAAPGDTLAQGDTGPVRNSNPLGGAVTIKSNSAVLDEADILVTDASYAGGNAIAGGNDVTSPAFDVDVLSFDLLDPNKDNDNDITTGDLKFADGTYHYNLQTAVTLGTATSATFGIVEDSAGDGVNAADPKTQVTITPSGAPASVDISTAQPATAVGQPVSFAVQVKDAAGNLTQLLSGESFGVTGQGGMTPAPATLNAASLQTGKATVAGTPGPTGGTQGLTVTGSGTVPASVTDSQTVTVYENAAITADEFGITTGADTWVDNTTTFGTATQVRVDQNSITFNIQSLDKVLPAGPDDAGKIVGLFLNSASIKFNGTASSGPGYVVPILLDSTGKGSATVALSDVTAGSTFTFSAPGSGITPATTVTLARAIPTSVSADAGAYITKIGSPTSVTVTVKDQFGNPIGAPAQVAIVRGARNGATTTARQTVDASGKATFTLPDAGTTAGTEAFQINLYEDQFAASPTASSPFAGGTINYTADGQGADFTIAGAGADPATTVITPLNDSSATTSDDTVTLTIAGATPNTPTKVTVDNGALVLASGETNLTQGAASDTIAAGNGSVKIVGTKTGVVTATIENGGRTKTVKLTVKQASGTVIADTARVATARNVELTGPEKANAGGVATFTAKVTDAFGNPVAGVAASSLNFVISGPANAQSQDAVTDANGEFKYNVILTDNANSQVTVTVTGVANGATPQFGKAANSVAVANDAPGISASEATDSVSITDVVNLAELEQAVEDAQDAVDEAQDDLEDAKDVLAVAKAEKQVAQKAVKGAKKDLKKAKKQKKGVKAAQAALRNAKGDLKIASTKVTSANKKVNREKEDLAEAQEALAAAEQALEDAQSEGSEG